jgi:hypothetical protein
MVSKLDGSSQKQIPMNKDMLNQDQLQSPLPPSPSEFLNRRPMLHPNPRTQDCINDTSPHLRGSSLPL